MKRKANKQEIIDLTQTKRPAKLAQATLVASPKGPLVGPPRDDEKHEACDLSSLSEQLQQRMRDAVAHQLEGYRRAQKEERCAFSPDHAGTMRVAYRVRYYDELVRDYLVVHDTGATQDRFLEDWVGYHLLHAKLRLLCAHCHQTQHPQFVADRPRHKRPSLQQLRQAEQTRPSVNEVLRPYADSGAPEHAWLDAASWGAPNAKGNYARQLDGAYFTVFQRNGRWLYVYQGKYGAERHATLQEALRASYADYTETIRRCV